MASFENQKKLRIVITLGDGSFGDSDQITLENYRASLNISNAGGLQMGQLTGNIYGMKVSDMDAVTSYARYFGVFKPNTIVVYAIDGKQESLVFTGNIVTAWAEYGGMPDVCLNIQAQAAALDMLKAVPPRSFKGTIDVPNVMSQIAASMGYTFKNNGVAATLENVYLANTGMEQARELARQANIELVLGEGKTMTITPKGKAISDGVKPLISRTTGMIGYPTYDGVTVVCRTFYNPAIHLYNLVTIETDVKRANGDWLVLSIDHALDSEMPDGQWFSVFRAVNPALYGNF